MEVTKCGRSALGAFIVLFLFSCTSGGTDRFQRNYPTDGTTLDEIKAAIPAILSLFDNVDPAVAAQKQGGIFEGTKDEIVQGIISYSELVREPLPAMIDAVSYPLQQAYRHYDDAPTEFNDAFNIGGDLVDVKEAGVTQPTNTLASYIEYFGNSADLYSSAATDKFPLKSDWLNCDSLTFDNQVDALRTTLDALVVPNDEPGRVKLLLGYANMRIAYCSFVGGYGDPANAQGEFYYKYLVAKKNAGHDFKKALQDNIDYIEQNIAKITSNEETVADWLVGDKNKKLVTDFAADDLYRLARKDIVFNGMKPIADMIGSWLSTKNPDDTSEYLFEWLLKTARDDAAPLTPGGFDPNIARLDAIVEIDTTNKLVQWVEGFTNIANSHSLPKALSNMGSGNMNNGIAAFIDILWDGRTYPDADGGTQSVPQNETPMYNDGSPTVGNADAAQYVPFRLHVHDVINGDNDGQLWGADFDNDTADTNPLNPTSGMRKRISPTYQGETAGQALLTNLYLHVLETYYNASLNKWSVSPADGVSYFGERDRNLQSFAANLQYALRNAVVLDRFGNAPGDIGYRNIPLIFDLLYFFAIGGGNIQPSVVPEVGTFKQSLINLGSADLAASGTMSVLGLFTLRVFCNNSDCNPEGGPPVEPYRNGYPVSINLNQGPLEFLQPGRFKQRNRSNNNTNPAGSYAGPWRGKYSTHQGDIENADARIGMLMNPLVADAAWRGSGPYTVKGKAPNGSKLKYENDWYTDNYYSKGLRGRSCATWICVCTSPVNIALGNNNGAYTGCGTSGLNETSTAGGNLHFYEGVYRPMKVLPSDPDPACWADAQPMADGITVKYGYLRPDNNAGYYNDNNCTGWVKVRVDFENREEAIRKNFLWLMRQKKMFALIPINTTIEVLGGVGGGASLNNYVAMGGNGLLGLLKARSAGPNPDNNGEFYLGPGDLDADGTGHIQNRPIGSTANGFTRELAANGASITRRWSHMSYVDTDATFTYLLSMRVWGIAGLFTDIAETFWEKLGSSTFSPPLTLENVPQLETLVDAIYGSADLMAAGAAANSTENMAKFEKFFTDYFSTDEKMADGSPGANGIPDLYDAWVLSGSSPGCKDGNGDDLEFCVTDEQLPTLPKVTGVKYPDTFNANGQAASWYTHTEPSDGKFMPIVLPLVLMMGTTFEGTDAIDDGTGAPLTAGANPDKYTIRNFIPNGFRSNQLEASHMMNGLSDLFKTTNPADCPLDSETPPAANTYCPAYRADSWLISLIEDSPGARNGLLPTALSSSKLHLAFAKFFISDLENLANNSVFNSMQRLNLTKGNNVDKAGYFTTKEASFDAVGAGAPFTTNYLQSIGHEPIDLLKQFIGQMRKATSDAEVVQIIKNAIPVMNAMRLIAAKGKYIKLDDDDVDQIVGFVNREAANSNCPTACIFVVDKFLDFLADNKLNDLKSLYKLNIDSAGAFMTNLKDAFDELNDYFIEEEGKDLRKYLLYGVLMDEPCDVGVNGLCDWTDSNGNKVYENTESGEAFLDFNEDGVWSEGMFEFREFYGPPYDTFTDETDVNGTITVLTPAPNFFNIHSYDLEFGGPGKTPGLTRTKLDDFLNKLKDPADIFGKLQEVVDERTTKLYAREVDEPAFDRDGDGTIEDAETLVPPDVNGDGKYDIGDGYIDLNGNGAWDWAEYTDINGDGQYTTIANVVPEPYVENLPSNGQYDGPEIFFNLNGSTYTGPPNGCEKPGMPTWDPGEPCVDINKNGQCDWELGPDPATPTDGDIEAWTDSNNNCKRDAAITLRDMLTYRGGKFAQFVTDFDNAGKLQALSGAFGELFHPDCQNYWIDLSTCVAGSTGNAPQNAQYLTERFLIARQAFSDNIPFKGKDIKALKNVLGYLMFDDSPGVNTHTHFMTRIMQNMVPIMRISKETIDASIDRTIRSLAANGSMRYTLNTMRLGPQFHEIHLLRDVDALMNFKVIRNHGTPDTFWYQLGDLIAGFSKDIYKQNNLSFSMDKTLFWRFNDIFK